MPATTVRWTLALSLLVASPVFVGVAGAGGTDDFNSCVVGIGGPDPFSCTFHCHAGNRVAIHVSGPGAAGLAVCGGKTAACANDPLTPDALLPLPMWVCQDMSDLGTTEDGTGTCTSVGPVPAVVIQCQNFSF